MRASSSFNCADPFLRKSPMLHQELSILFGKYIICHLKIMILFVTIIYFDGIMYLPALFCPLDFSSSCSGYWSFWRCLPQQDCTYLSRTGTKPTSKPFSCRFAQTRTLYKNIHKYILIISILVTKQWNSSVEPIDVVNLYFTAIVWFRQKKLGTFARSTQLRFFSTLLYIIRQQIENHYIIFRRTQHRHSQRRYWSRNMTTFIRNNCNLYLVIDPNYKFVSKFPECQNQSVILIRN